MGCCQQFISSPNEIITLDREMEREKRRQLGLDSIKNEHILEESSNKRIKVDSDLFDTVQKRNSIESNNEDLPTFLSTTLLNEINQIRTNPLSYIPKIDKYMNLVETDKSGSSYININNNKIMLPQGKEAFQEAKTALSNAKSIHKIQKKKNLCIPFPKGENITKSDSIDYLKEEFEKIKQNVGNKYKDLSFFCDKNISNTEFVTVLNFLDMNDENKTKRHCILNEDYNVIGITTGVIDTINHVYCYYIVIGKESEDEF